VAQEDKPLSDETKALIEMAEGGDAEAQFDLGYAYYRGEGVLKDYVTAYAWYSLSAFNGDEMGQENRDDLAKEMRPE